MLGKLLDSLPLSQPKRKKIKLGGLAPKLGLGIFALCYTVLFAFMGCQSVMAYVQNFVIFDDLGK
jgi:hypothetical protein